jgi:hypothetical protein
VKGGTTAKSSRTPAPCTVHGSLSDNAATAVTLDEFISRVVQIEDTPPQQLNHALNGRYPILRDTRNRLIKDYRYVRTPGSSKTRHSCGARSRVRTHCSAKLGSKAEERSTS